MLNYFSHFFLLLHIANHQQMFFSEMSLEQTALNYVHYCNSLMLTIALDSWSPLIIINLNCTIWFPMIDKVTQWTREKVVHLTQICRLIWPGFITDNDCYVCTTQAIGSRTLLLNYYAGASSCALQPSTYERPHVNIHQHSCQNTRYWSSKWQWFLFALQR